MGSGTSPIGTLLSPCYCSPMTTAPRAPGLTPADLEDLWRRAPVGYAVAIRNEVLRALWCQCSEQHRSTRPLPVHRSRRSLRLVLNRRRSGHRRMGTR